MSDLISHHGKVLYWGTSEWPAEAIFAATEFARANGLVPPSTEQAQYNLLVRHRVEEEYKDLYSRIGLGLMVWSPLAYGLLAGRYTGASPTGGRLARAGYAWLREELLGEREVERLAAAARLAELAEELGMTPACLSMAWVLSNQNVSTAITGVSNLGQLHDTLDSLSLLEKGMIGPLREPLEALFESDAHGSR